MQGDGSTSASDPLNSNPADHDYIDLPQNSGLESSDEEAQDELTTRHYQRIQRAEESWLNLREAMLWTTLYNQGSLLEELYRSQVKRVVDARLRERDHGL